MNSLHLKKLYCPIRCEWVSAQPEEYVRQRLLRYMIDDLGYPKGLIVVEKALDQLPHLQGKGQLPDRRVDILVYGKEVGAALVPLLLIECKAVKLTARVINQVTGYNHYLGARFVAIVNDEEVQTGYLDTKSRGYLFVPRLPGYKELLASYSLARSRD